MNMKNILSYTNNEKFTGKEIKDWINYHINHQTSLSSEATKMKEYLNIDDNSMYVIQKGTYQASERRYCIIKA